MSEEKLLETRVRYRYRENSLDGRLLKFLLNFPDKDIKDLLWEAAKMCFLPIAYVRLGGHDPKELKNLAVFSFFELSRQWNYIQIELKLDLPTPKTILQSMESSGIDLDISNDEVQPIVLKDRISPIFADNTTDNQSPETNQQDDIWDEDVELQMELTDEQTAIRQDIRSLFG
ncbi:hypothetical protein A0J48_026105 [Sphaerospermopsis aphanizomenoides BCCUSP55]|uniref:hypothetical protein n=1 Tax=Sphaerospermopsis aphanizomenoides TaxID=459663 RepID=UPI0019033474|nr:hypothetical protein [Sphaerospermopsis aphanizomenoides]MBK1990942.1 hypothetical protein [Sphaerospermopsis aphanizomenoides BCCUSP55]